MSQVPCLPQEGGILSALGGSFEEPGDFEECATGLVPQGRKFVALVLDITYSNTTSLDRADAQLQTSVVVSIAGQELYRDVSIASPSQFPASTTTFTDQAGRVYTLYRRRVEKVLLLPSNLTAASTAQIQLYVGGRRLTAPPVDPDSISVTAFLHSDLRFVLTETPYGFAPRDSSEPTAVSGCAASTTPDPNCFPSYTAALVYSLPDGQIDRTIKLDGRIRFNLMRVSSLKGKSSNFGDETTPDYRLDPARQTPGLFDPPGANANALLTRLITRAEPSLRATVRVTSLDYAGEAQLKAFFFPGNGNEPIAAEIDASNAGSPTGQPADPSCECASLPYDRNKNRIADSWEEGLLGTLQFFETEQDEEPGTQPTSPRGDGLIAHAEYRGFHFIERIGNTVNVRWSRTDAKSTREVFVWAPNETRIFARVKDILGAQNPLIVYREVLREQANAISPKPNTGLPWVGPIIRNPISRQQLGRRAFALVYLKETLPEPATLGNAQSLENEGKPILVDVDKVDRSADRLRMGRDLLLAQVVAHEAGHKFTLEHPWRITPNPSKPVSLEFVSLTSNSLNTLSASQFTIIFPPNKNSSNEIYVRLQAYDDPVLGIERIADGPVIQRGALFAKVSTATVAERDPNRFHVYKLKLEDRIQNTWNVQVLAGQGHIMDWSPRSTFRSLEQWQFTFADLSKMCVKEKCQ